MANVEHAVRNFLQRELGKDASTLRLDESLLETGTIDSMGVLQLVGFLESTFGIKVEDDDLMPENFDTIGAITSFVERRQVKARD